MRGIKGFIETSLLDWWGMISSVVFLGGCNLRCPYCHNPSLVLEPDSLEDLPLDYILERLGALLGWVDGVCITGGEPTLNQGLEDMIRAIRDLGFKVKLDTNGTRPWVLKALLEEGLLDCVAMDIKAPLEPMAYGRCTGLRRVPLDAIRMSLDILLKAEIEVEFRTTFVPTLLTERDIMDIAGLIGGRRPYMLQRFRPEGVLDPRLRCTKPPTEEEFRRLSRAII